MLVSNSRSCQNPIFAIFMLPLKNPLAVLSLSTCLWLVPHGVFAEDILPAPQIAAATPMYSYVSYDSCLEDAEQIYAKICAGEMDGDIEHRGGFFVDHCRESKVAQAKYLLASFYEQGWACPQNRDLARELYLEAAALQHAPSLYRLGRIYQQGLGVAIDEKKALDYFIKAAQSGYPYAAIALGECYLKGRGVVADEKKALELIGEARKKLLEIIAADPSFQHDVFLFAKSDAMLELGRLCEFGIGEKVDTAAAHNWYLKASNFKKYPQAELALADYYVRQNKNFDKQAVALLLKLAELCYPAANLQVWNYYVEGKIAPDNVATALQCLKKASKQQILAARMELAYCCRRGVGEELNEHRAAATYYKTAQDFKHATAYRELGLMYANGQGVEASESCAIENLQQAVDLGDVAAGCYLGKIFLASGKKTRGLQLLEQAAQQGSAEAAYHIAMQIINAPEGGDDVKRAFGLLQNAAQKNYLPAMFQQAYCYLQGVGTARNAELARSGFAATVKAAKSVRQTNEKSGDIERYKAADKSVQAEAAYLLGLCYYKGYGVPADLANGKKYLSLAASKGERRAAGLLKVIKK